MIVATCGINGQKTPNFEFVYSVLIAIIVALQVCSMIFLCFIVIEAREVLLTTKLLIFGLDDFADIAYEYFTYDSDYTVIWFCAERE